MQIGGQAKDSTYVTASRRFCGQLPPAAAAATGITGTSSGDMKNSRAPAAASKPLMGQLASPMPRAELEALDAHLAALLNLLEKS